MFIYVFLIYILILKNIQIFHVFFFYKTDIITIKNFTNVHDTNEKFYLNKFILTFKKT
jgi:hypothetical protein